METVLVANLQVACSPGTIQTNMTAVLVGISPKLVRAEILTNHTLRSCEAEEVNEGPSMTIRESIMKIVENEVFSCKYSYHIFV